MFALLRPACGAAGHGLFYLGGVRPRIVERCDHRGTGAGGGRAISEAPRQLVGVGFALGRIIVGVENIQPLAASCSGKQNENRYQYPSRMRRAHVHTHGKGGGELNDETFASLEGGPQRLPWRGGARGPTSRLSGRGEFTRTIESARALSKASAEVPVAAPLNHRGVDAVIFGQADVFLGACRGAARQGDAERSSARETVSASDVSALGSQPPFEAPMRAPLRGGRKLEGVGEKWNPLAEEGA